LMAGAAELGQFVALMIHDVYKFVASVGHDHVLLLRITREAHPPRGTPGVRRFFLVTLDPDILLERSHLVEHLDAVALAVANVDQALVVHHYAMHHAHELATLSGGGFFLAGLFAKLSQEFSVFVENRDAVITV